MSTSSSGISTEVVVGIAIAVAAVLVSFCLSWKKRRRRSNDHCVPPPPPGHKTPGSTYEVFLSFRGPDTRYGFTGHLYNSLVREGVKTFMDVVELRKGEEIGPDLIKAIEESSISIPIFSKDYASSKYCLMELTQMVKRMNERDPEGRRRHTVYPIFYDVTPEVVKRQTESFAEAFLQHKKKFGVQKVQEWKDALEEVGRLLGWEKSANSYEAEFIEKIVTEVCEKLKKRNVSLTDDLVGMDHHIEEMTKLLDIYSGNVVRIVGIVGMGGIGKTTIAKFMYNQLLDQFRPHCSFLEDVRETVERTGFDEVRKKLTSNVLKPIVDKPKIDKDTFRDKKVLIVLDDVKDRFQLKEIIGGHDSQLAIHKYFGSGSRIIVTTRNKDVFDIEEDLIYEPRKMNYDDSLKLFCKYAFKSNQPGEDFVDISRKIVQTAAGLPLSLVVIGSMLRLKKSKDYWKDTWKKLKVIPHNDVQERLKISFGALEDGQRKIFLDIACHFIGEDRTLPYYMWKDCSSEFYPDCDINDLVSLSLITIEKQRVAGRDTYVFKMHDHLRDLGRDIVKQENKSNPGKRSRLWSREEARQVLDEKSGTKKVETLSVNYRWDSDCIISNEHFKGLSRLRYLSLECVRLKGDFEGLVSNLRWFRLRSFKKPKGVFDIAPITNFCPRKLVVLDLSGSNISDGWESRIQMEAATNLKVLNLSGCYLTKLPECLWNMKSLVELDLSHTEIAELSEKGIGNLTDLIKLFLSSSRIKRLPDAIGKLKKLEELHCSSTRLEGQLHEGIGRLSSLRVLNLSRTEVDGLPENVESLCNLRKLDLSFNNRLKKLPGMGIEQLRKLEVLDCSSTNLEGQLHEGIGRLSSLRVLNLSRTKVDGLPENVESLHNLRKLDLSFNNRLKKLPGMGIEKLQKLEELDCSSTELEGQLHEGIGRLSSLRVLNLNETVIDTLPENVESLCNLRKLDLSFNNRLKKLPEMGIEKLQKLEELDCHMCSSLEGEVPEEIWRLFSLRVLKLSGTKITGGIPKDISGLSKLETLDLGDCKKLQLPVEGLKLPLSLTKVHIPLTEASLNGVRGLVNLRDLEFHKNVGYCCEPVAGGVDRDNNNNGTLLPIIHMPSNLVVLTLKELDDHVMSYHLLPAMKFDSSSRLTILEISSCIFGIGKLPLDLTSLELLELYNCRHLMDVDLSNYQMLTTLRISKCQDMSEIKGPGVLTSLEELIIEDCHHLMQIDLSNCQMLKILEIEECTVMTEIKGLGVLTSLEELIVDDCPQLMHIDLPNCQMLKRLEIKKCTVMTEIKGPGVLTSLEELIVDDCPQLMQIDLSNCQMLKRLEIKKCTVMTEIKGLGVLTSLKELIVDDCPQLMQADLPNYQIARCSKD